MERELLMIGSTCVDCVIPVGRLPKTGDDIQPAYQRFAIGGTGWNACRAAILTGDRKVGVVPVRMAARPAFQPVPPMAKRS